MRKLAFGVWILAGPLNKEGHIMMKIEKIVILPKDMEYYKLEQEKILP
jgi:hypothetical protein